MRLSYQGKLLNGFDDKSECVARVCLHALSTITIEDSGLVGGMKRRIFVETDNDHDDDFVRAESLDSAN